MRRAGKAVHRRAPRRDEVAGSGGGGDGDNAGGGDCHLLRLGACGRSGAARIRCRVEEGHVNYKPVKEGNDLLAVGEYDASVKVAEEKISKSGNEMIELQLEVYSEGRRVPVFDYLMAEGFEWKMRHFCESAGLDYERGEMSDSELIGLSLRVHLGQEKQAGYPMKSKVTDYVPRLQAGVATGGAVSESGVDDDLPF